VCVNAYFNFPRTRYKWESVEVLYSIYTYRQWYSSLPPLLLTQWRKLTLALSQIDATVDLVRLTDSNWQYWSYVDCSKYVGVVTIDLTVYFFWYYSYRRSTVNQRPVQFFDVVLVVQYLQVLTTWRQYSTYSTWQPTKWQWRSFHRDTDTLHTHYWSTQVANR
jgi:hypothetical protein